MSAAPFFNQSNCIFYALIQSEMEQQTSGPSVRNKAIFKTMCWDRKQTKPIIPWSCLRTPGATASVLSRISDPQELGSGPGCFPTCPRYFPGQGRLCCLGREWAAEPEPGLSQSRAKYGGDTWSQARDTWRVTSSQVSRTTHPTNQSFHRDSQINWTTPYNLKIWQLAEPWCLCLYLDILYDYIGF